MHGLNSYSVTVMRPLSLDHNHKNLIEGCSIMVTNTGAYSSCIIYNSGDWGDHFTMGLSNCYRYG